LTNKCCVSRLIGFAPSLLCPGSLIAMLGTAGCLSPELRQKKLAVDGPFTVP
jgi:hypothetical protein